MCTLTSDVGTARDGTDGGFTSQINGEAVTVAEDKKLTNALRNDCHLKFVRDGCSEGVCGTRTVLVDGKPTKACVQKILKFMGKSIVMMGGPTDREKEVFVYVFGEAGAVQCSFCISGMVMCAKGLLDANDHPTRMEIAMVLRNNICRCTGYKKTTDVVELAAKLFREDVKDLKAGHITDVGQRAHRVDVHEKVLGCGEYVDDMEIEHMIYGSAIRTPYPRARVLSIDKSKALVLPGVRAVLTAEDVPGNNKAGYLKKDWDTMTPVGGTTRYVGNAVCLVAADTLEILKEAKKLVEIGYEELPGVFSPEEALAEEAPLAHETGSLLVHEYLVRSDVEQAIKDAAYVVTMDYETPSTEHAFLEPECATAIVDEDGQEALLYTSDQGIYDTQHECAGMLGWDNDKVYVINKLVGGGSGDKEGISVQHHAALLSYHTGLLMKVKSTRKESIMVHSKHHPAKMTFMTACDKDNYLLGMKTVAVTDTGAHASLGRPVFQRSCTRAAGPYNYQDIDIDGKAACTNNPPAGALRGLSMTQSCFVTERNLNLLAEKVGTSPWEIRYRNAIRPGQVLPNGQIAFLDTALAETLEAVKEIYENHPRVGIARAMKNADVGIGFPDWGRCRLMVEDGKAHIRPGVSCIGQGFGTALVQMTCKALGILDTDIVYVPAEMNLAPDSGTIPGSRQTLVTGEVLKQACDDLKVDLEGKTLADLNSREYYGEYLVAIDRMGTDKENPVSHVAYGYVTQVALLREGGTVEQIVAVHDVGKVINPLSVEGQIKGGVVMSLGYALTEDYPLEQGRPTAKLDTLGLFHANKTPDMKSTTMEKNKDTLAFGAVGIREITSIPTAPAVQGAYYRLDGEFRAKFPLERTLYSKKK